MYVPLNIASSRDQADFKTASNKNWGSQKFLKLLGIVSNRMTVGISEIL